MTADQLIQYLTWAVYVLIFVSALLAALRRPLRANIDIALLFAAPAFIVALSVAALPGIGLLQSSTLLGEIDLSLLLVMAYMLLRLVDDFSDVPKWLIRGAEVILLLFIIATFAFLSLSSIWLLTLELVYVVLLILYAVVAFI